MKNKLNIMLYGVVTLLCIITILLFLKYLHLSLFLRLLNVVLGLFFSVLSFQLTQKLKPQFSYLIRFLILVGSTFLILTFFKIDTYISIKYAYLMIFHGLILGIWARTRLFEWNLVTRLLNIAATVFLLVHVFQISQNKFDNYIPILFSLSIFTLAQIVILIKGQRYLKESNF